MPFWWTRRKRFWYGNRRRWRFRRPRRRRRPRFRRRFTRTYKTRRKRRHRRRKVRRKRQTIPVRQWQPDSIRKCKIKGLGELVLGAEGSQLDCFTQQKNIYVPPKVPWGGGFGVENFTLSYLYEENVFTNNIWTATNIGKDLTRYLGCRFDFYRHPNTDFVIAYDRQPPHIINKFTYPGAHPQMLLLQKHHRVILSTASKPNGKYKTKVRIKPPKQMITKWFFTKAFSTASLFLLQGSAANFRYSHLSGTNTNMQLTVYSLNTAYFQIPDWAQRQTSKGYWPYGTIQFPVQYKKSNNTTGEIPDKAKNDYLFSVNHDTGFFKAEFLLSKGITKGSTTFAVHATIAARYNPNIDNGKGNEIYVISTLQQSWKNVSDKQFLITETPLWLGLYGYYSYILTIKPKDYLLSHVIVLKSKALYCYPELGSCDLYCPIDWIYMTGKKPYEQTITQTQNTYWYPDMTWQKQTINSIVESGPFIPKYSEEKYSTWELKYKYCFYFKWGGAQSPEQPITNPQELDTYDVPDTMPKTVQIRNPEKISGEATLHPWDWRRGIIEKPALKRMLQHLETDSEFQIDTEETPKKKRKGAALQNPQEETQEIDQCLQTLFKSDIFQEQQEEESIRQLIHQQQQQQEQLKYSILQLLFDLKEKQRIIQHQTGLLD
nr:MAG: ORF1 [Torque teno midi virus]